MTQKIMGMALLCMVLTTTTSAQPAATAYTGYQQTLFDGNFLGYANQTYYGLSLRNNGQYITGLLTTTRDESYQVSAAVGAGNIIQAKAGNYPFTYDCKLYYSGHNLILELDSDLTAAARLLLILAGETETAFNMESRIVLKRVE